ncbi:MAG: zinc-binding dehydrogenase [Nitriliruptorales bacterium]|nr:zinc-binding dehydrogenase [Nitriliruptorales bacterium]
MTATMRALAVDLVSPRGVLSTVAGGFRDELRYGGTGSVLQLTEVPVPERRRGWVRIRPTLAGICASDHKLLTLTAHSITLSALHGLPWQRIVPGHEIVGEVVEADPDAQVSPGDRVVAENLVSCVHKGFARCSRCEDSLEGLCAHFADEGTATRGGFGFGNHADYGGGWSEQLVAPEELVHPVPDDLDDRTAVLAEPTAIGVHAILSNPPARDGRILVVGPGGIGLTLCHALSALVPAAEVTVAGLGHFADGLAVRAGAAHLLHGTGRELVTSAGEVLGTPVRGNRLSGPVLEDGFDVIYDTVGSEQTLNDAIRMLRPRGELVLIATAAERSLDLGLVWHRELSIRGTAFYGRSDVPDGALVPGGRRREMAIALDVLGQQRPDDLVTHVFALGDHLEALRTSAAGPAREAVRVAFDPAA